MLPVTAKVKPNRERGFSKGDSGMVSLIHQNIQAFPSLGVLFRFSEKSMWCKQDASMAGHVDYKCQTKQPIKFL